MLAPADRLLLPRAVVLLRLARAVEQGRRGAVLSLRAKLEAQQRAASPSSARPTGAELELWALEKERDYFFEVFGRELTCAEV